MIIIMWERGGKAMFFSAHVSSTDLRQNKVKLDQSSRHHKLIRF